MKTVISMSQRMRRIALPANSQLAKGPIPSGFTSAMIGAIMGDACDRLPVVMLINAAIRSFCLSLSGRPRREGAGMRRMDMTSLAITAVATVAVVLLLVVSLVL